MSKKLLPLILGNISTYASVSGARPLVQSLPLHSHSPGTDCCIWEAPRNAQFESLLLQNATFIDKYQVFATEQ
jgi:hypothetical protein